MGRRKNEVKLSTDLTPKQRAFVDILVANWGNISKADACLQAGYTTKDPNRKPFEIASRLTNPEINPHICRYLEKRLSQELNKYEKLPQYISDYFYDISKELEICGNDKIKIESVLVKVNDKELFINNLNVYLEKNVDIFLEMNEDEVIDY